MGGARSRLRLPLRRLTRDFFFDILLLLLGWGRGTGARRLGRLLFLTTPFALRLAAIAN